MSNQKLRKELALKSFGWFFHTYFSHYITFPTAQFHWDIYDDIENDDNKFIELLAFRGSAKSTIASLGYVIYATITGKKKFAVLISDSFPQAKTHIANIIYELEENKLLNHDFGPFQGKNEWQATNVVLNNNARILSRSRGQKVRGLRHLQYRPDLIIADDVENVDSVRTMEQRQKTYEWFGSEVLPSIDPELGRIILIGNLLHGDSLMSRYKQLIIEKDIGVLKEYPIKKGDKILWHERFNEKILEDLRLKSGSRFFQREYMLKLVPTDGQIVKEVMYYDKLPKLNAIAVGVDLAISEKKTADYTSINAIAEGLDGKFYNLSNVASRWNFNQTLQKINEVYETYTKIYKDVPVYLGIEDVAYQRSAIEEYTRRFKVQPQSIKVNKDKRARLETKQPYFESGQVYFKREGDEDVISEIVNFGIEPHDDRMDAFLISLDMLVERPKYDIDFF